YGRKPAEFIIERACKVTDFFIEKGVDLIVVACNTATAAAISYLREHYDVPFVGMEPALKPAALHSKSKVIGILATAGTFKGKLYQNTLAKYGEEIEVLEARGDGLVEAVESGNLHSEATVGLLHKYIDPMIEKGADHIVLGCTHYPFLKEEIEKIVAGKAAIVDPAPPVSRHVYDLLYGGGKEIPADREGVTKFYSTCTTPYRADILEHSCGQPLRWRYLSL
ncbi:MAG: aspartate/glutamate racemase family protein, partial [Bacteroidales bacterium]|nr:aspartate/glutamate racemase family protein [Bacteroidales bacterium]